MEFTSWTLYWVTRLDGIGCTFAILMILLGIVLSVSTLGLLILTIEDGYPRQATRPLKISISAFALLLLLSVFTPTTKEMAAILVLPKVAQSEVVTEDIPELYELGVSWLKTQVPTVSTNK